MLRHAALNTSQKIIYICTLFMNIILSAHLKGASEEVNR